MLWPTWAKDDNGSSFSREKIVWQKYHILGENDKESSTGETSSTGGSHAAANTKNPATRRGSMLKESWGILFFAEVGSD